MLEFAGSDGILRNPSRPSDMPGTLVALLDRAARHAPDRPFVIETAPARPDAVARATTYAEARHAAHRIAANLAATTPPGAVVVALPPGVDHLLLTLAAYVAGRPVVPVSPAVFEHDDEVRLRLLRAVGPGLVAVPSGRCVPAAERLDAPVFAATTPEGPAAPLATLLAADADTGAVPPRPPDPASVCKLLLTSGSTGVPKAVAQTHRMLTANQGMLAALLPEACAGPPVVVDWLPWSHTFGGNHDLHLVLAHAGTLVVDEGPARDPDLSRRLRRLSAFRPTAIFDVPRVFDRLVASWEQATDDAARALSRAEVVFYAGASLSADTFDRLRRLLARHGPPGAFVSCGYGATETGPLVTAVPAALARTRKDPRGIGIPAPGASVRLARADAGTELWVSSPAVAPYYVGPDGTRAPVADVDGWFHTGDAGSLLDPADVAAGLRIDGRLAENFKLATGTWVPVAAVRERLAAALGPQVRHVVLVGPDAPFLAALLFVDGDPAPGLVRRVRDVLTHLAADGGGSSRIVRAAALVARALDPAAGEITEKGSVHEARVRTRCADLVAALYDGTRTATVPIVRVDDPQSST
ncbi:MAG: hypothetical protein D6705_03470 [Deltaproteobacteria bacterium]|nr:MAG: hypothetical protein D6705_03470 [Deltaproteobacteria bacterium]